MEAREAARQMCLADLLHQPQVEAQVVEAEQLPAERLAALHQMMQVRPAVEPAGIAVARRIERLRRQAGRRAAGRSCRARCRPSPAAPAPSAGCSRTCRRRGAPPRGCRSACRRPSGSAGWSAGSRAAVSSVVSSRTLRLADGEAADGVALEALHRRASWAALARRRSGCEPPWTMANRACVESPRAARERAAQRWVSSIAARAWACGAVASMQWSRTIMMSEPIARCMAIERSGVKAGAARRRRRGTRPPPRSWRGRGPARRAGSRRSR